jgi:hypothetical protein
MHDGYGETSRPGNENDERRNGGDQRSGHRHRGHDDRRRPRPTAGQSYRSAHRFRPGLARDRPVREGDQHDSQTDRTDYAHCRRFHTESGDALGEGESNIEVADRDNRHDGEQRQESRQQISSQDSQEGSAQWRLVIANPGSEDLGTRCPGSSRGSNGKREDEEQHADRRTISRSLDGRSPPERGFLPAGASIVESTPPRVHSVTP